MPKTRKAKSDASGSSDRKSSFRWLCESGSTLCSAEWISYCNEDYACFAMLGIGNGQVYVRLSVSVSKIFQVQVFENGKKVFLPSISNTSIESVVTRDNVIALLDQVQKTYESPPQMPDDHDLDEKPPANEFPRDLEMSPTILNRLCSEAAENAKSYELPDDSWLTAIKTEINNGCHSISSLQDFQENHIDIEVNVENQPIVKYERPNTSRLVVDSEESKSRLVKHLVDKDMFVCPICDKQLANQRNLSAHMCIHSGSGEEPTRKSKRVRVSARYKENYDDEATEENTDEDVISDGGAVKSKCDVCGTILNSQESLTQHKLLLHSGKEVFVVVDGRNPSFKCVECDKTFGVKSAFYRHYRSHLTKEFQCDRCEMTFALDVQLRNHMIVHDDKCPFECKICGKHFKRKAGLDKHAKFAHSDERSFACDTCRKSFKHERDLQKHAIKCCIFDKTECKDEDKMEGNTDDDTESESDSNRPKCDVCGTVLSSQESLAQHKLLVHSGKEVFVVVDGPNPFKCAECDKTFVVKSALFRHYRSCHLTKEFQCDRCEMSFALSFELVKHRTVHDDRCSFECNICGNRFKRKTGLDEHTKYVHSSDQESSFVCDICSTSFNHARNLRRHAIKHHSVAKNALGEKNFRMRVTSAENLSTDDDEKSSRRRTANVKEIDEMEKSGERSTDGNNGPVKCDLCLAFHESKESLAAHKILIHSGETFHVVISGPTPFKCKDCDKSYSNRSALHKHYRIHHMKKEVKCKQCDKVFARNEELREHMIVHDDKCPFQCDACGKAFKRKSTMYRHRRYVHSDERLFFCDHCSKSFKLASNLNQHLRIHAREETGHRRRTFTCDICAKQLTSAESLRYHRHIHTGEKSFQCPVCSKRFRTRHTSKLHMYCHTGKERPRYAKCPKCPRRFGSNCHLQKHLKIHLTENLFRCVVCEKICRTEWNLTVHQRTHTEDKPYLCQYCSQEFARHSNMVKHRLQCESKPSHDGVVELRGCLEDTIDCLEETLDCVEETIV